MANYLAKTKTLLIKVIRDPILSLVKRNNLNWDSAATN